jgi:hypothetical protein
VIVVKQAKKMIEWLILAGALWFVFVGVDWNRVTISDLPFLKVFFGFNEGGMQLLAGTLLIMLAGFCVMVQQLKPAIALLFLGALFATMSGKSVFRPCDELNHSVSCREIITRAAVNQTGNQTRPLPLRVFPQTLGNNTSTGAPTNLPGVSVTWRPIGRPVELGRPVVVGQPVQVGRPINIGRPLEVGKPADVGRPW